ncbi:hypothetical protein SCHPADRAFT_998432 [Schizopora paradoxa]|uniref:DUF6533 domain-containing protein n=1 Tax=Schizopora paradoxa TaxID=27342 RepID=A0A0H2RJ82_9AGAM|nr:hypothetical protein SCHPADRAFT_998432 [Schizopora paradoxa]
MLQIKFIRLAHIIGVTLQRDTPAPTLVGDSKRAMNELQPSGPAAILANGLHQIQIVHYFVLSGITVWAYEYLTTFKSELLLMWMPRIRVGNLLRVVFLYCRYGILLQLLLFLYMTFPNEDFTSNRCNGITSMIFVMDILLAACGDGLVVYMICSSWNWRRDVTWILCSSIIVLYSAAIAFAGQTLSILLNEKDILFADFGFVRTCFVSSVPSSYVRAFILYASMDLFTLASFTLNALSRPRNASQRLFDVLIKDGISFLMVSFSLKLATILVIRVSDAPISIMFPVFSITLVSAATSRLYLRFCSASLELRRRQYAALGLLQ